MAIRVDELKRTVENMGFEDHFDENTILKNDLCMDSTEVVDFFETLKKNYNVVVPNDEYLRLSSLPAWKIVAYLHSLSKKSSKDEKSSEELSVTESHIEGSRKKGGIVKSLISPKTVKAKNICFGTVELKPEEILCKHVHDYSEEACYVQSGNGSVSINGNMVELEKGVAFLVPKGSEHEVKNTGNSILKLVFAVTPLAPYPEIGDRAIN